MSSAAEQQLADLQRDNLRLREENQILKSKLENKKSKLSNDAVDSAVAVVVILAIAFGVSFWLNGMPA